MKANEVVRNVVKEMLERNEVVASMTIRLTRGVEIARLAKTAGFDMIYTYIDLEHSTMTLDATGQICLAALSAGVAPMVRVPANTPEYIQRVLDGGALGIVAPGIRSALNEAAVRPAGGIGPEPNWFVVSITIFPARSPPCASASGITPHGTDKITISPNATAWAGSPTDALAPRADASSSSLDRSRVNDSITS